MFTAVLYGTATAASSVIVKRHDDLASGQSWWSRCNLCQWPLFKVVLGHKRLRALLAYKFLEKRDRAIWIVSLFSVCEEARIDIHLDLRPPLSSVTWGYLRSFFNPDFSESTKACFNASRREKHGGARIGAPTILIEKLFTRKKKHCGYLMSLTWSWRSTTDLRF